MHTSAKDPPLVAPRHVDAVQAYNARRAIQGKHRRGGKATLQQLVEPEPARKKTALRYPEVRGLRFSPEDSMFSNRDEKAALTIARLRCMEVLGQGRPAPFART